MNEKYKIIKNFFDKEKCLSMARHLENLLQKGTYRAPDSQCKLSPAFYGIFNNEFLEITDRLEREIGQELYPVYTYARIYQENDYLLPHFDRPGAEISFTLTLDYDKFIWPFWLQDENNIFQSILLDIGDILVYKGCEVSHFRHPMQGQDFQHQAFFHFVNKHGEFTHLKYDQRATMLTSQEAESWNFPDWSDDKFRKDPNYVINKIAARRE